MIGYGLLWLLRERPDYGYALYRRMQKRVGPAWRLNIGQVYQSLQGLAQARDVKERVGASSGRGAARRVYEITAKGRRSLDRWATQSGTKDRPFRDEGLLRLFVLEDGRYDDALSFVRERRELCDSWRHELRQQAEPLGGVAPETALIRELSEQAVMLRLDAYAQWLDVCEERFRALIDQPPA